MTAASDTESGAGHGRQGDPGCAEAKTLPEFRPETPSPGTSAATVDLAEADRRATFDAICRVWDQAVANCYPNQQALRRELANLQIYLDLEKRP